MSFASVQDLARRENLYPSVILHGGSDEERQQAALQLGRILLCDAPSELRPCGECRNCGRIVWPGSDTQQFHPDFSVLERDLKTATSIDATKSFLRTAQLSPFEARGQVFVIANSETLGGGAANALLKTLEEPPDTAPRNFLLLAPSQFDLLPTVRSRSLPVFLGVAELPNRDLIADLSRGFAASVREFANSRDPMHLLAAAEQLSAAGGWKDARAVQPWTLAAAAVKASLEFMPTSIDRSRVLALAEELLGAWRMRLRGIQAQRILEGLVVRNLSSARR
jgi:DNA polymerase-3 subunit delta'